MKEIEDGRSSIFFDYDMEKTEFLKVIEAAASEIGCKVVDVIFNDDDNVFDVTIDREGADVDLQDCEHVHRAVLSAFDRNIEDYALTVGSVGIGSDEADEILKTINE